MCIRDRGRRVEASRAVPATFVAGEDIDAKMDDQLAALKPPDQPHCYARGLMIPASYSEAMRSEYVRISKNLARREVRGLMDAGTSKPVLQPVENFTNSRWVYN